ncbi:MAG: DUF2262 domain-containing protein [Bacteroidales bacterium]|jgi:hypothetical protein|nr:DUF2262 domain-containing protein [Bacteroidales bacterium]
MNISDFTTSDDFSYEGSVAIWGKNKVNIAVDFPADAPDSALEQHMTVINEKLDWLRNSRNRILSVLIDNDLISEAEEWVCEAQPDEGYNDAYILEDDSRVLLPISEETFRNSVNIESVTFFFDDNNEPPIIELYLVCSPDYFAGHCIIVDVDEKNHIEYRNIDK